MKTPAFRLARAGLAALLLAALTGCTSLQTRTMPYVGAPRLAPTDPATIVILHAPPAGEHERLGEVTVDASVDPSPPMEKIEAALRTRAAALGANAVFIVHDSIQPVGYYTWGPWWSPSVSSIPGRIVVGVALRLK
ncbi:MAG TPA: hypothetical protein PKM73_00590 [Verrucomicrobiota bacterium]|nr:hypothetical protein [Verrucomicrobiota bacterium]HNU49839.1 hypothetical protein [Verrucomicrobiota bacterium]